MRARMLRTLGKPARTTQPGCARTKAATTAERPPNSTRRDRLRRRVRISLLAGAAGLAAVSVGPIAASAATYTFGFSEQTVF